MSEFSEKVMQKIESEEGRKHQVYTCTAGKLTVGVGFNIEDVPIPDAVINYWLKYNINELRKAMVKQLWFTHLPDFAKLVLIDMAYQMGVSGALQFKNMIMALVYKDYDKAADELLDSKYARQTPERANRNAEILRSGKI